MGQYRRWFHHRGYSLELVHGLDALCQPVCRLYSLVHLDQVFVHLLKVLVDELIDDLGR